MTDGAGKTSELLSALLDERGEAPPVAARPEVATPEAVEHLCAEAERLAIVDLARALQVGAALERLAQGLQDHVLAARVHRARAQVLAYANRFDDALAALDAALDLSRRNDDEVGAASAELGRLHALARLGRLDEAVEAGEAARRTFLAHDEPVLAGRSEVNLGVTLRMRGEPEAALERFAQARERLSEHPVILAQIESNRAEALLDLDRFQEAEQGFLLALRRFGEAGLRRGEAIVEGNLADLLSRQGRCERALYHFERARGMLADDAPGDAARLESEQAEAFASAGLWDEAAECCEAALQALDRHGLAVEAARTRATLGLALARCGRREQAAEALDEAARRFVRLEHRAGLGRVRALQAELASGRGETARARSLLEEALSLHADRPALAAEAALRTALLSLDTEGPEQARATIEDVVATARRLGLASLLGEALHARARVRGADGDRAGALADLRSAVEQIERIRGSLPADRLRAAFVDRHGAAFDDLVLALLDEDDERLLPEAFARVEQARARSLLDLVAGVIDPATALPAERDGRAPSPIVGEVVTLRGEINALYARLWNADGDRDQKADGRQTLAGIEARERRLAVLESRLAAAGGIGGIFAPPADLPAAQSLVGPGTALVEYYLARDELVAFVVRPDGCRVVRGLATRRELAEAAERLHFELGRVAGYDREAARRSERLLDTSVAALRDLHRLVLAPLTRDLQDLHRLVIIPAGPLHGVPIHALHDGRGFLIERYAIAYAPSASLLGRLPRERSRGGSPLVVGVADRLAPRIDEEVRAVAAALDDPVVLRGDHATQAAFSRAARDAGLVHVACHGRLAAERPLSSGLRLADGWLTVRDVYGLSLDRAVVVLSGCDTGRSVVAGGDDLVGLVSGFLAAGAATLVMSLWTLDDDTAESTMVRAYGLWHNGSGPGSVLDAVRTAQLEQLRECAHPAYWAPLVVVGRT